MLAICLAGVWAGGFMLGVRYGWRLFSKREIEHMRDLNQKWLDVFYGGEKPPKKDTRPS